MIGLKNVENIEDSRARSVGKSAAIHMCIRCRERVKRSRSLFAFRSERTVCLQFARIEKYRGGIRVNGSIDREAIPTFRNAFSPSPSSPHPDKQNATISIARLY